MITRETLRRRTTLVAVFKTQRALVETLDHLLGLGLDDVLDIGHAALITRDEQGAVVTVNNNVTPREGLFSGAALGATIGGLTMLLLGAGDLPKAAAALSVAAGLLLGGMIGAALGRLVAHLVGFGYEPDLLRDLERQLQPGQVALLLRVRAPSVPLLRRELGARGTIMGAAGE